MSDHMHQLLQYVVMAMFIVCESFRLQSDTMANATKRWLLVLPVSIQ
jgi:hypothetical protein